MSTILVTGSTGKTGRRVSRLLGARGLPTRNTSRHGAIPFDWDAPATWPQAVQGVAAAYVVFPDLGNPQRIESAKQFAKTAAGAGVRKVVLVSFPAPGGIDMGPVTDTERQFSDAGLALTILRLRWFNQNFNEDFLLAPARNGEFRLPAGDGREAFVDADDIAEVAVASLSDDIYNNREYELTGPEALSFSDVASELTRATTRTVTYTPVTREQYAAEQHLLGVPDEWTKTLIDLYAQIESGVLSKTTNDISDVLGRPARDFRSFATANAGDWSAPADS